MLFVHAVAAPPIWRNSQRPHDVDVVEDDDVVFECNVIGRPKPTVSWTYNAQPLDQGLLMYYICLEVVVVVVVVVHHVSKKVPPNS